MSIGDQRYGTAAPIQKGTGHPDQRATGRALGGGLASGYAYAQQNPRFLGAWVAPHGRGRRVDSTTLADSTQLRLFVGEVWLAEYVTHVRAELAFGIGAGFEYVTEQHMLVGGAWSTTATETLNADDADYPSSVTQNFHGEIFLRSLEVAVSPSSGGQYADVRVWLERGESANQSYFLHSCTIIGEVR